MIQNLHVNYVYIELYVLMTLHDRVSTLHHVFIIENLQYLPGIAIVQKLRSRYFYRTMLANLVHKKPEYVMIM